VVWFRHKTGEAGFRCPSCAEKHLGCPFRDFTFGVADKKMPTVLSSKKGDVFLPRPADTKGRKTSIKPTPTKRVVQVASMERSRSEGSVTSNRSSETREVTPVIQTSRNTKMPMATSSKPNPSAPTPVLSVSNVAASERVEVVGGLPSSDWGNIGGRSLAFFLENLLRYEDVIRDPSRSLTSLNNARDELAVARTREQGALETVKTAISARSRTMDEIQSRLEMAAGLLLADEQRTFKRGLVKVGREDLAQAYSDNGEEEN
jgi:hypothetical protein